jgi:hypothetical protein
MKANGEAESYKHLNSLKEQIDEKEVFITI